MVNDTLFDVLLNAILRIKGESDVMSYRKQVHETTKVQTHTGSISIIDGHSALLVSIVHC
jgi:hypothetical protein